MITTHPQRWNDRWLPWTTELISQNMKNVIKRLFLVSKSNNSFFSTINTIIGQINMWPMKNMFTLLEIPSPLTQTRDLQDLVAKNIFFKTGQYKNARYPLLPDTVN